MTRFTNQMNIRSKICLEAYLSEDILRVHSDQRAIKKCDIKVFYKHVHRVSGCIENFVPTKAKTI